MRKNLFVLVFVLVLLLLVLGINYNFTGKVLDVEDVSSISRSFVGGIVGENIYVTLDVLIDSSFDHSVYIIEEIVPDGFEIIDAGTASQVGNVLKWADVNDVAGVSSIDLIYAIRTSQAGTYSLYGNYGIDGMDIAKTIIGSSLIQVDDSGAAEEICGDGIDNDGDGYIDNLDSDCGGICDTDNDGFDEFFWCIGGGPNTDCNDDDFSVNPDAPEVCNGIDDDCNDLSVDGENEVWYLDSTTCGVGECSGFGIDACIDGNHVDTCAPGLPVVEICDSLDNNCNNLIDEDLTQPTSCGLGVCSENVGIQTCDYGAW